MDETEILIKEVRKYPYLYNPGHKEYNNTLKRLEAWRDIGIILNLDAEAVKSKWRNLRDSYAKYKRSLRDSTGRTSKKYKNWPWGSHLQFLECSAVPKSLRFNSSESIVSMSESSRLQRTIDPAERDSALNLQSSSTRNGRKEAKAQDNIEKFLNFLETKNQDKTKTSDEINQLFLYYANTFKKFNPRRQAALKIKLANLFAEAELSQLDEEIATEMTHTPISPQNLQPAYVAPIEHHFVPPPPVSFADYSVVKSET